MRPTYADIVEDKKWLGSAVSGFNRFGQQGRLIGGNSPEPKIGFAALSILTKRLISHLRRRLSQSFITMPEVGDVKCWLEDGDTRKPFEEYQSEANGATASTTVISEEGKVFTINAMMGFEGWAICLDIGGTWVTNFGFESGTPAPQARILGLQKSEIVYAPWVFSHKYFKGTFSNRFNLTLIDAVEGKGTLKQERKESQIIVEVYRSTGKTIAVRTTYADEKAKLKRKTVGKRGRAEGLGDCVLFLLF